jgi:flagellar protein FliL
MKKSRQLLVLTLACLLTAAAAGGSAWWWLKRQPPATEAAAKPKPAFDKQEYKYISLDKVIVMLRGQAGEPLSHYLAVDLVFKTTLEKERLVKEHLPLLRSVAVMALSTYPLDKASAMTVEQLAADINTAYEASYARDNHEKPFVEALIGKLIIE